MPDLGSGAVRRVGSSPSIRTFIAKIAQLVEHNLAKVGVAGSSPVFRSHHALVVELVDTQDLKSCIFGCTGSSPVWGT